LLDKIEKPMNVNIRAVSGERNIKRDLVFDLFL